MALLGDPTPPAGLPVPEVTPAAPTPLETEAEELVRLRVQVAASLHPVRGPPPGTIPPPAAPPGNRLDGMHQMLTAMLADQQELATANTMSLLARHERDLAYQARQTALLETQRTRAALIGTTQTRTPNIARQLDMLETLLMDQLVVVEMFGRAIEPPAPSPIFIFSTMKCPCYIFLMQNTIFVHNFLAKNVILS